MFDTHKLKELRLAAGESQATIAGVLNVTQQAYANYESGRRKPDIMVVSKLAKHFDIMIHDFFTDEDIEKPASVIADGDDVISILQDLRSRPELKMLFDAGRKATPETVRKTARFLEELAKGENSD